MKILDFRSKFWAPCVIFLPTEKGFLPECLHYEMERLASVRSISQDQDEYHWYKWATVDSQLFFFFFFFFFFLFPTVSQL